MAATTYQVTFEDNLIGNITAPPLSVTTDSVPDLHNYNVMVEVHRFMARYLPGWRYEVNVVNVTEGRGSGTVITGFHQQDAITITPRQVAAFTVTPHEEGPNL